MSEDQINLFHASRDEGMDVGDNLEDRVELDRRENAFYLQRTKENNLPQKCLDNIVEGISQVVKKHCGQYKKPTKEVF